jgi:stearoyl-CoA desaturase (delta-9 desaturase)
MYIRILTALGLARVKKVAPRPVIRADKHGIDVDTARAIIAGRLYIMAQYAKRVMLPVFRDQLRSADMPYRTALKNIRHALVREESRLDKQLRERLHEALRHNEALHTVYEHRRRLQALWGRTHESHERISQALQDWCHQAEATRLKVLQDFARGLKGYSLQWDSRRAS